MTVDTILELVIAFFTDPRVQAIGALIIMDVLLGVAAALKSREFDFEKVADFYQTNVVPYILGYLALYVGTKLIVDPAAILGEWSHIVGEAAISVAWAAIIASLGGSIWANVKKMGLGAA